jgi:excisionase family DNA binding protein
MDQPILTGWPKAKPAKLLLTVNEAAAVLSVGRTVCYRLVMREEIASVKVGRSRRIPLAAVQVYIRRQLAEAQHAS